MDFRNYVRPLIILSLWALTRPNFLCTADSIASFDINPFQTTLVSPPSLVIRFSTFQLVTLKNNAVRGAIIEGLYNQSAQGSNLFGGPLQPNAVFRQYSVNFNINATYGGTTGITFNGVGAPIIADTYWYNAKYSSPTAAASFNDGIVVVRNLVRIGAANPYFGTFQTALNQLMVPGANVQQTNYFATNWFMPSQIVNFYYSYSCLFVNTNAIGFPVIPNRYGTAFVVPLQYSATISSLQFLSLLQATGFLSLFHVSAPRQPNVPVFQSNTPMLRTYTI